MNLEPTYPSKLKNKQYRVVLGMDSFVEFGKYKGTDVKFLLDKHPAYLCWLLDKHLLDHPKSEMKIEFKPELLTAILDKIIDDPACAQWKGLLPEEYTAEKREAKRAAEREAAEKAAVYESMDWGGF